VVDEGDDAEDDELGAGSKKHARLLVLEDAGELLGADARSRTGQGLSRLLNMTDGLPGQATRTRVLITTNEDVGRLHPAIIRPGRCGALIRFTPFDDVESGRWLSAHGREDLNAEGRSPATLAELFALHRGEAAAAVRAGAAVGFSRAR
jgi:ATP-dependent 26S proteasome regulatory subunit